MNTLANLPVLITGLKWRRESAKSAAAIARQGMLFATLEKNRCRKAPFHGPVAAIRPYNPAGGL
jgi:hypothetical protein